MTGGAGPGRGRTVAGATAGLVLSLAGVSASAWAVVRDGLSLVSPALLWADFLAYSVIGAVIVLARPANRVGWLMLAGGACSLLGGAAIDIANHDLLHGGAVPGASAYAVAGACARTAGWSLVAVLVSAYFPHGRPLPGRWRWLPRVAVSGIALGLVGSALATHAQLTELPHWRNPLSTTASNAIADPLSGLSMVITVGATIAAAVRLAGCWRRGDALERQRIGLFAAVAVLPIFAVVLGVTGVTGAGMFGLMLLPLPVGIGFAVLARGLYDLSTAANRTLVWGTLSATVIGIYALVIAGLGETLRVRGAHWLPWVAAAVVAICFAPLRDALQRAVNRITFGRWDDPYRVLAELGQHLEASADVDRLLGEVVDELAATLGLRHVAIVDSTGALLAGQPTAETTDAVPLVAYGSALGRLCFTAPAPLRPADRRLLDDLAGHVAGLLHAHGLTRDLQRARERLVLAREEERRRLRRDLHDGLGPALAGQALRLELIARGVPPQSAAWDGLQALRAELQTTVADVRRLVEGLRPAALDEVGLAAAINAAVRRITAGTTLDCRVEVAELPALSAAVEVAATASCAKR